MAQKTIKKQVDDEHVHYLTPRDLQNKAFFGRNRNYFVQIVHEPPGVDQALHPQYYQLKRLARKKSQPLFPYKLRLTDFLLPTTATTDSNTSDSIEPAASQLDPVLARMFNVHGGVEEWRTLSHFVVNEDGLKMPVSAADAQGEGAIGFKFVMNPTKIDNLDDLYDAFEVNKGSNVKYLLICNPGGHSSPADMTLQQKLFRKFFYENSSFIDSEVKFIEVTNERVAARIGLDHPDKIMLVQNENPFGPLSQTQDDSNRFKLMNLQLERIYCKELTQETLERRYIKYLKGGISKKEFENEFLLSEDHIDEVFSLLCAFVEDALIHKPEVLYAQTKRMLTMYRNYLRKRQQRVLFLQVEGSEAGLPPLMERVRAFKRENPDVKVVLSDLKDASQTFSLFEDRNTYT